VTLGGCALGICMSSSTAAHDYHSFCEGRDMLNGVCLLNDLGDDIAGAHCHGWGMTSCLFCKYVEN
jgi:hypothetical protein